MNYEIIVTKAAKIDIENALDYIDFVLKNPEAAEILLFEIANNLTRLQQLPFAYPIIAENWYKSKQIRMFPVNNYLAFYFVDNNNNNNIVILRFLYKKRNWRNIIRQIK